MEYEEKKPLLEQLADQAKQVLSREITRKKVEIYSLTHRIKGFDSLRDKIQRKKIKDPFREIEDLVGLRVVCLFRSHIESIRGIIRNTFEVIEEDDKTDNTAEYIFGYLEMHFTVKLKGIRSNRDLARLIDIPFEVQVRTIGQDAWASVSHHLYYKQEDTVPGHLRRDFYALSGLFHVADSQFDSLRGQLSKHTNHKDSNEK